MLNKKPGFHILIAFSLMSLFSAYTSQAQFITKWKTTTANESITIPTAVSTTYNYSVNWGDGSALSTGQTGDATHTYVTAGTYTVVITGTFPRINFKSAANKTKIIEISQWGSNAWASMNGAFSGCTNLNLTATDAPILTSVVDMASMFSGCASLNPTGNAATALNTWNTSTVVSMYEMFSQAITFNQNIGNWNTAAVQDMSYMFFYAIVFNQNIGNWNTSAVKTMAGLFYYAYAFNQDISNWNTEAVTNMGYMFLYATAFNQNIASWKTGAVTNMYGMFAYASAFNQDISSWNTGAVTIMTSMFMRNKGFNQDISTWNTSKVNDMSGMFNGASGFNKNLGGLKITSATNMMNMLDECGMNIANYDNTLIGWLAQTPKRNVYMTALFVKYCNGANARTTLMTSYGWSITLDVFDCNVAPIELKSFTTQKSGNNAVQINWATGTESGVASMSVERSSDGANWKSVYLCLPKGSNSQYEAMDNNPLAGTNYYRLLTTDLDGSKKYSAIRTINFSNSILPKIFPNPTTGPFTVSNIAAGDVIVLTDITGRQLLRKQAGNETELLDMSAMTQGLYFIKITRNGRIVANDKITKLR